MHACSLKFLIVGLAIAALTGSRPVAQGSPDAAKVQNPVAATPESLAEGKARYTRYCATCHGTNGQGSPANDLIPETPSLTDKEWIYGSTDGEIFETIKKGVPPEFNMAAWGEQGFKDQDIWNVINYIRTLAKK